MTVSRNPLVTPQPVSVRPFTPVRDLAPTTRDPLMLRFNGEWLLRDDWGRIVAPGDVIEWHEMPQGGNASRVVLLVVAIALLTQGIPLGAVYGIEGAGLTGVKLFAATIAASAVINALVPLQGQAQFGGALASPGSVYNTSTAANQARPGQPIPVIYGRHRVFPDYADSAQPYIEYKDNDQYFHAVYCVGQGDYVLPDASIFIDDTQLSHFRDVWYAILPPGTMPSRVHANVETSPEVAGQSLLGGRYTSAFAACAPGQIATAIGVDILFDRLGVAGGDGSMSTKAVPVRVEARAIDDFGAATGAWFELGTRTFSAATTTPQRFSEKFELPTPDRVEVRCVRTDLRDENAQVFNDPIWGGLRAYLLRPSTLSASATHFELVMRASEQLSGISQRKINMIPRRKLRTWSPGGGLTVPVETRSIAWALLDVWTNPVYGDGLPASRVDLQTLYDLDQVWAARQDRLDIVFDSRITSWDAAKTIAQAGRAVPFRRMGVNTLARDQLQTLPVTAFTTRNMLPGASVGYSLPTEVTADGIIVEYFANRSWGWRDIMCRAPGVVTPVNPVRLRIAGITGAKHAEREGLYQATQNLYRRKFTKGSTELQGLLPAYGSLVVFAPPMAAIVQAGDVVEWDEPSLVLSLTEPVKFTAGKNHFVSLIRDDGSVTSPIPATAGTDDHDIVLSVAPDFDVVFDDPNRERTHFYFGTTDGHRVMTRVLGIRKSGRGNDGAETIEVTGVVEDNRVHAADNHLLPGPGDIQDQVDSVAVPVGEEFSTIVNLVGTANAGSTSSVGITVSEINSDWILRLELPAGQTHVAWSAWSSDGDQDVPGGGAWCNSFRVTDGGGLTATFGANGVATTDEAARSAFVPDTITGATSYTFWIADDGPGDNRGGLSIRITRT